MKVKKSNKLEPLEVLVSTIFSLQLPVDFLLVFSLSKEIEPELLRLKDALENLEHQKNLKIQILCAGLRWQSKK